MRKIVSIVGARPQFIKYSPLSLELQKFFKDVCVHTGQHYDTEMSQIFFDDLKISKPKYHLKAGGGTHAAQTGKMLIEIESILIDEAPDCVIVFGDTNTTLAGALAAAKLFLPVAHIEAGLRSFNNKMPEEHNRVLTDHCSKIHFSPTLLGLKNLKNEGITQEVYVTGDIMVDSLHLALNYLKGENKISIYKEGFILTTIHRNYNTDDRNRLITILETLNKLPLKVIFPMHPRTKERLEYWNYDIQNLRNIKLVKPAGYFDFIKMLSSCDYVITDSGGIQKEAYILKKPCITLRTETEWVETLRGNWNILIGEDFKKIFSVLETSRSNYKKNLYGDGTAAKKIVNILKNSFK